MKVKRTGKKIFKKEKGKWVSKFEGKSAAHATREMKRLKKAGAKEEKK